MAKRASTSGDQLTGGTKDVNPQFLSGRVTMTAANTAITVPLGTPIVRVGPQTSGQAIIMEVLKVWVQMPNIDTDAAAATSRVFQASFRTVASTTAPGALDDPRCFAFFERTVRNAFTAAGTGMLDYQNDPLCFDCTDGAGHGILIATDNVFITVLTSGQTAAEAFPFKILYRFKKVSLIEYIGIVQSQQ